MIDWASVGQVFIGDKSGAHVGSVEYLREQVFRVAVTQFDHRVALVGRAEFEAVGELRAQHRIAFLVGQFVEFELERIEVLVARAIYAA